MKEEDWRGGMKREDGRMEGGKERLREASREREGGGEKREEGRRRVDFTEKLRKSLGGGCVCTSVYTVPTAC